MVGSFDAPKLSLPMEDEELFCTSSELSHLFPSRWKPVCCENNTDVSDESAPTILPSAPDVRPFTSKELSDLYQSDDYFALDERATISEQRTKAKGSDAIQTPFHNFALHWPGADPTVPPCTQIIGTTTHGVNRWNTWLQNGGLNKYGKVRNDAKNVNGSSRMSAYLNLGIVSIFRVVSDAKRIQKQQNEKKGTMSKWDNKNKSGGDKFEEEIIKFREFSYAHAFSRLDYDDVTTLPRWSVQCLNDAFGASYGGSYNLSELASGKTNDVKWNAMQQYLVRTGELHNNVRMTWGKTVVEWRAERSANNDAYSTPAHLLLRTLCYLNDRYALDGLSPPSYSGILWCVGWTDKPTSNGGIPTKPASQYRMTDEEFIEAERRLLSSSLVVSSSGRSSNAYQQRSVLDMMQPNSSSRVNAYKIGSKADNNNTPKGDKRKATIDSFFQKRPKTKDSADESKQVVG